MCCIQVPTLGTPVTFLKKVKDLELKYNDWKFTMDVMSLYMNIPHSEGIKCIRDLLHSKR